MFHTQIKFQMAKNFIFSQFRKQFRIQNWFNPEFRKQDSHPSTHRFATELTTPSSEGQTSARSFSLHRALYRLRLRVGVRGRAGYAAVSGFNLSSHVWVVLTSTGLLELTWSDDIRLDFYSAHFSQNVNALHTVVSSLRDLSSLSQLTSRQVS